MLRRACDASISASPPGIQFVPASGTPRHRRRLDRQRDEIFRLEIVHMALAAGPRYGLRLESQDREIVGETPSRRDRIETGGELWVLRGDAGGIATLVPVVIGAGGCSQRVVFRLERGVVVAEGDQRRGADRDGVRAESQRLRDVGAAANAAGHDQLHLPMQPEILERLDRRTNGGERRNSDMLDEHLLRRRRAALHAVHTMTSAPAFTANAVS